jgi:TorA maturation chaperone TorD
MLPPEEAARASIYAFLAHLFRAPPEPQLLEAIGAADEVSAEGSAILEPWIELAYAAAATDVQSLRREYQTVFARRRRARAAVERFCERCEALRDSIARGEAGLEDQRRFFQKRILPAAAALHRSVHEAKAGRFYRRLDRFAAAFFRVERAAFDLPDPSDWSPA